MCGQPSNVKRFAQSSPLIVDACIEGGTWAKSGSPCSANTFSGSNTGTISNTASITYTLAEQIPTKSSSIKKKLMIWGQYLVFNNKDEDLTVHLNSIARNDLLFPPLPYVEDLRCSNVEVYGLDNDGNCEAGCGIICDLPSGQGSNNIITAASEKERISNGHFRLDYMPPSLDKSKFTSPTVGMQRLEIDGDNFGFNASVKVGNVLPTFEPDNKCICSGGLHCGHDALADASSSSTSGRGCFLNKIEQSHTKIVVSLPAGVGTGIDFTVLVVNQQSTAKLSFDAPTIDATNSGPFLVSTVGRDLVTIKGSNFGGHPFVADTYNTNTRSYIDVDSALGAKRSSSTFTASASSSSTTSLQRNELKLHSWNHTTIVFQVPEGDGIEWDISITAGNQLISLPKKLNYKTPSVLNVMPNQGVLTDGTDGALIDLVTFHKDGTGSVKHVGFNLAPPKIDDVISIYHCNENVDGNYFVTNITSSTSFHFVRPGNPGTIFIKGNWTGGYVSGGKPVVMTILGNNFGVRQVDVLLNGALFHTFEGRNIDDANEQNNATNVSLVVNPTRTHEKLVLVVPSGVGANLIVSVKVGDQTSQTIGSTASQLFSYLPPHVFSVEPTDLSTLGCKYIDWK
jgi:hypothetical protein